MGTAAGKAIFLLSALVVATIAIGLGAEPKLFAGNEKVAFLAMAVIAGFGMCAYFVGLRTKTLVITIGMIVAAYLVYSSSEGAGDPLSLFHRLMGRGY